MEKQQVELVKDLVAHVEVWEIMGTIPERLGPFHQTQPLNPPTGAWEILSDKILYAFSKVFVQRHLFECDEERFEQLWVAQTEFIKANGCP